MIRLESPSTAPNPKYIEKLLKLLISVMTLVFSRRRRTLLLFFDSFLVGIITKSTR